MPFSQQASKLPPRAPVKPDSQVHSRLPTLSRVASPPPKDAALAANSGPAFRNRVPRFSHRTRPSDRQDINVAGQRARVERDRKIQQRVDIQEQERRDRELESRSKFVAHASHNLLAESQRLQQETPQHITSPLTRDNRWYELVHSDVDIMLDPRQPRDYSESIRTQLASLQLFPCVEQPNQEESAPKPIFRKDSSASSFKQGVGVAVAPKSSSFAPLQVGDQLEDDEELALAYVPTPRYGVPNPKTAAVRFGMLPALQ